MIVHTMTGKQVSIMTPDPDTLDIADIAHNLARINRFNGATKIPYSVASHSVWVSKTVPEKFALSGLLHDASEAYLGDIIAPLKPLLSEYGRIEFQFDAAVRRRFGVSIGVLAPDRLREADSAAALLEMFALGHPVYEEYKTHLNHLDAVYLRQPVVPQSPECAEKIFLERYYELTEGK